MRAQAHFIVSTSPVDDVQRMVHFIRHATNNNHGVGYSNNYLDVRLPIEHDRYRHLRSNYITAGRWNDVSRVHGGS